MLLLILIAYVFCFLAVGALVYVGVALIPAVRRCALSSALFCVACAPGVFAGLTAYLFLNQWASSGRDHWPDPVPFWRHVLVWLLVGLIVAGALLFASSVALAHQTLIHRVTFALFRLYATAVSAGVGGTLGLSAIAAVLWERLWPLRPESLTGATLISIAGLVFLLPMVTIGWLAYRYARALRGERPESFCPVTIDEFYGYRPG